MRYAVISDIHANLEAFTAVLHRIAGLNADRILCLGDVVGYNANPNECVDIIRKEGITTILGNHDAVAAGLDDPDDFNPLAMRAVLWTREALTEENGKFLRGLPRELPVDDLFLFHGSIHDTNRYIMSRDDVRNNFLFMEDIENHPVVGFYGHTHIRSSFSSLSGVISVELGQQITVAPEKRYLINPGSAGQPRDGDPRAGFAVYDATERTIAFHRVEYDIAACQDKVIKAGLPPRLADRLAWGR
jgi:diadenosine tetraphosphatase ApaH/serine/threonine PP2A family protein phosphatase